MVHSKWIEIISKYPSGLTITDLIKDQSTADILDVSEYVLICNCLRELFDEDFKDRGSSAFLALHLCAQLMYVARNNCLGTKIKTCLGLIDKGPITSDQVTRLIVKLKSKELSSNGRDQPLARIFKEAVCIHGYMESVPYSYIVNHPLFLSSITLDHLKKLKQILIDNQVNSEYDAGTKRFIVLLQVVITHITNNPNQSMEKYAKSIWSPPGTQLPYDLVLHVIELLQKPTNYCGSCSIL